MPLSNLTPTQKYGGLAGGIVLLVISFVAGRYTATTDVKNLAEATKKIASLEKENKAEKQTSDNLRKSLAKLEPATPAPTKPVPVATPTKVAEGNGYVVEIYSDHVCVKKGSQELWRNSLKGVVDADLSNAKYIGFVYADGNVTVHNAESGKPL